MNRSRESPKTFRKYLPDSPSVSAAFLAYEVISAAAFALVFAPYVLIRMIGTPAFRAGIKQRFSLPSAMAAMELGHEPVWIQAASLGEVRSVAPLVQRINEDAGCPVFLTSTTATGFNAAARLVAPQKTNAYFPLDFSPIIKRALSFVRPRAIVLFETEIWPNFIRTAALRGIPVIIVNGRISEKSYKYYRAVPKIFNHVLSRIRFAGMQSKEDAERARALGVRADAIEICGNMKFDSAPSPPSPQTILSLRAELRLDENAPVIVAGSTHEGEETALLDAYRNMLQRFPSLRLVLAPRHPERFAGVEAMIRSAGFPVYKKSEASTSGAPAPNSVILLDTMGELARVYDLATVTFVGGSLVRVGGHNIIEPASMCKPVLFGPFMHHFEDIKEAFLGERAAVCAADERQLHDTMLNLLENPGEAQAMGEAARRVVETNRGATDRYYRALRKYILTPAEKV